MRWLRSILAVVLSCLLLCSLLCLYVLHVLERTVVETNTALTAYVQKSVDTRLEELHRYSTTIEITHANTLLKNLRELPGTLPRRRTSFPSRCGIFSSRTSSPGAYTSITRARGLWWAIWALRGRLLLRPAGRAAARGYDAWLAGADRKAMTRASCCCRCPRTNACAMCARCA